ncbi:MAG: phytanoyl-CoA dioxygenase, partial [Candidatus Poribacteria bacterium]|nr:phytanoyl-CoA dioxygenase [Candidatus Poribacteria bacterium]
METLSHKDRVFWQENGYVVIPNVVSAENLTAATNAIAEFTGKNLEDRRSWYQEPMVHGGMINMNHHQALWDNRQSQIVYQ